VPVSRSPSFCVKNRSSYAACDSSSSRNARFAKWYRVAKRLNMFKKHAGDWTELRKLTPAPWEIDYHADPNEPDGLDRWQRMDETIKGALEILKRAQEDRVTYVMFLHGSSTSRPGATTHRSQIRKLMRSKEATPYVIRNDCIQHPSVFVAAIRPKFETNPLE
jgi:hypothetical protein